MNGGTCATNGIEDDECFRQMSIDMIVNGKVRVKTIIAVSIKIFVLVQW